MLDEANHFVRYHYGAVRIIDPGKRWGAVTWMAHYREMRV